MVAPPTGFLVAASRTKPRSLPSTAPRRISRVIVLVDDLGASAAAGRVVRVGRAEEQVPHRERRAVAEAVGRQPDVEAGVEDEPRHRPHARAERQVLLALPVDAVGPLIGGERRAHGVAHEHVAVTDGDVDVVLEDEVEPDLVARERQRRVDGGGELEAARIDAVAEGLDHARADAGVVGRRRCALPRGQKVDRVVEHVAEVDVEAQRHLRRRLGVAQIEATPPGRARSSSPTRARSRPTPS